MSEHESKVETASSVAGRDHLRSCRCGVRSATLVAFAAGLLLIAGCGKQERPKKADREPVKIVAVTFSHEVGANDWTTVVEFGTGERRMRQGKYGEVGDTFNARRIGEDYWE